MQERHIAIDLLSSERSTESMSLRPSRRSSRLKDDGKRKLKLNDSDSDEEVIKKHNPSMKHLHYEEQHETDQRFDDSMVLEEKQKRKNGRGSSIGPTRREGNENGKSSDERRGGGGKDNSNGRSSNKIDNDDNGHKNRRKGKSTSPRRRNGHERAHKNDEENQLQQRRTVTVDDLEKGSSKDSKEVEDCIDQLPFSQVNRNDKLSMLILLVLYTLQGIPMGLQNSIPLILKENGASYDKLSIFSQVTLPFALKLLWAPLVDTCYMRSMGRRKTWLVPVQLITGFVMIAFAPAVHSWLGSDAEDGEEPNIMALFTFFAFLFFMMATQDIAVDGWALTMLSKENRGYASTCNTIGQMFGIMIADRGFIMLSDPVWCGRYLPTALVAPGTALLTLSSFMAFFGCVFIAVTVLVWLFKSEVPLDASEEPEGLIDTYQQIYSISKLPPVKSLVFILLTIRMAFAASEGVANFQLMEAGMHKSDLTMFTPLTMTLSLVLPALIANRVTHDPLKVLKWGISLKIIGGIISWVLVQATISAYADPSGRPSLTYFICLALVFLYIEAADTIVYASLMAYFAKVSDPAIGGTYMTMLNTIANLGYRWKTLATYLVPRVGIAGYDGYTVETIGCLVIGIIWYIACNKVLDRLRATKSSDWLVEKGTESSSSDGMRAGSSISKRAKNR